MAQGFEISLLDANDLLIFRRPVTLAAAGVLLVTQAKLHIERLGRRF